MRRFAGTAALLAATAATPVAAQELLGFERRDFGSVVLSQRQSAGAEPDLQLEAAVGSYRNEMVARYSPNVGFRRLGRAVGRLDVITDAQVYPCTAFIVSETYIVTNYHCVPGVVDRTPATKIIGAEFIAGYVTEGVSEGTRVFRANPIPVEANEGLDYAVLEVAGNPSEDWGMLELAAAQIEDGRPFWIIGHPLGEAQRISREDCASAAPAIASGRLRHTCDTLPGNSGSPVIDTDTRMVVALHHAGSRRSGTNYAIPMSDIIAASAVLQTLLGDRGADVPVTPAQASADECEPAARHFEIAREMGTRRALESHLQFYGDCDYAPFAQGMLEALDEETPVAQAPVVKTPRAPVVVEAPADRRSTPPRGTEVSGTPVERCDALAASPFDADLPAGVPGVDAGEIDLFAAEEACRAAVAAAPGELRSLFNLGRVIEIRGRDDREAERYYRDAAEQGYAAAQSSLGWLYENGKGVEASDIDAVAWYRRAAEGGDVVAQNNLGFFYERGRGVARSGPRAEFWYVRAAENGYALAQANLGWLYEAGEIVQRDMQQAARWYLAAAEQGNVIAQGNIGWLYQTGNGVRQDDREAARWFRAAAEQGNARGQLNLGWLYENGRGVPQDDREAVRYYRLAAEQGDARGMGNLGWMIQYGRGVAASDTEAVFWYRKSAEAGDASGQVNYGYMLETGSGVAQDVVEAARWYKASAEQGNATGQVNYGWMLQEGSGVAQDDAEAAHWYGRSADQGNPRAAVNLGWLYEQGRGVEQSDAEAARLYRTGAEGGNVVGMTNYAYFLEQGIGVRRDVNEAIRWYRAAADQGNQRAIDALERLGG